jgi:hypothetical protein
MVGKDTYTRRIEISADQFTIDATIEVEDFVDCPDALADDLQQAVGDALIEFVVSGNTD